MPALPGLVYNGLTKTGNEALIYWNPRPGRMIGRIFHDGTSVQKSATTACGTPTQPTGGFVARLLMSRNEADINGIPALSPLYTAEEIDSAVPSNDINDFDAAPTVAGDGVTIVSLPNPADDVLICHDRGFSMNPGVTQRPIPRKMEAANHHVMQRAENSINLTDLFVSNWDGVQAIRGQEGTIIVKIFPNATAAPQEIQYYSGAVLNPQPMNAPSESNDSIEISMDGTFNFAAIFSAAKP